MKTIIYFTISLLIIYFATVSCNQQNKQVSNSDSIIKVDIGLKMLQFMKLTFVSLQMKEHLMHLFHI